MWVDAALYNPQKYPYTGDYFARGTMAVQDSVSALMGVHINGTVVIDLLGFVDLITALTPHGFKINNPYEVKQIPGTPYTDSFGKELYGLDFKQGDLTLNGEQVLAYARLRHVVGHDSDTFRMARQQLVLKALIGQVNPCQVATNITNVTNAIRGTLWSNIDLRADAGQWICGERHSRLGQHQRSAGLPGQAQERPQGRPVRVQHQQRRRRWWWGGRRLQLLSAC
jgi:LCP family protein required for cell wall assembly